MGRMVFAVALLMQTTDAGPDIHGFDLFTWDMSRAEVQQALGINQPGRTDRYRWKLQSSEGGNISDLAVFDYPVNVPKGTELEPINTTLSFKFKQDRLWRVSIGAGDGWGTAANCDVGLRIQSTITGKHGAGKFQRFNDNPQTDKVFRTMWTWMTPSTAFGVEMRHTLVFGPDQCTWSVSYGNRSQGGSF